MSREEQTGISRRTFLHGIGGVAITTGAAEMVGSAAADPGVLSNEDVPRDADGNVIPGFERSNENAPESRKPWQPVSSRKVQVGIAGYGLCQFGAQFFFQTHPNVEVVAVSDLDPKRCASLAKACRCEKTYPSCEEMIKDDAIEAIFIATDAPSHAPLAILALNHGKHVASAVPAMFGPNATDDAERLFEAVKASGKKYMMFETSTFHRECHALRQQYQAGALGKLIYSEGEYYHYKGKTLTSYNPITGAIDSYGWRRGLPPMWYATHSTAYYISVSGGRLTNVSCLGMPSIVDHLKPQNNAYRNAFGTEIAMLRTSEGGMSRMVVSWDTPSASGVKGRVYGQTLDHDSHVDRPRPPLPREVRGGGHGGSHGYLTNDFIESILLNRKPIVGVGEALNMTLAGVVAHQSALKDGEWMEIPQFDL